MFNSSNWHCTQFLGVLSYPMYCRFCSVDYRYVPITHLCGLLSNQSLIATYHVFSLVGILTKVNFVKCCKAPVCWLLFYFLSLSHYRVMLNRSLPPTSPPITSCECGYLHWQVHILSNVLSFNPYYRIVNVDICLAGPHHLYVPSHSTHFT